jgi:hypothetical protein
MNKEQELLLRYRKRTIIFFAISFAAMLIANILELIVFAKVDVEPLYNAIMEYINNQTPFNIYDYVDTFTIVMYFVILFINSLMYPFIILAIINLVKFIRLRKRVFLAAANNVPREDDPYAYTQAEESDYKRYQEEKLNEEIRQKENEAETLSREIEKIKNFTDSDESDEIFK